MTHTKIRTNTKATLTCLKMNKKRQPLHLCAHAVQIRGENFRSKFAKLGGHLFSSLLVECTGIAFWSYLFLGDKLGRATDIDRLLASSRLSTPFFTLIGNGYFWSCHKDFMPKCRQRFELGVFLDISVARSSRVLKMIEPACTLYIVPGSVVPIFTS